jgi:hypothetical protein
MNIVGAGLSGLIAAHIWPNAEVFEIAEGPSEQHKALLRFRSEVVQQVTGIEFKKVKVRKGIWAYNVFVQPNIQIANAYSAKCLGFIQPERSIWNIEPVERYIAPKDLYSMMVDNCLRRIHWGVNYSFDKEPCISTIPMPVLLRKLNIQFPQDFHHKTITVQRFLIKDCEAYQTIYYPVSNHSVYRASITGDLLIVEHAGEPYGNWDEEIRASFGLWGAEIFELGAVEQKYGKIAPVDDAMRKHQLFELTTKHNIYSLGRFAIWKNILLDDVVEDAAVIKRLMRGSHYDALKEMK